MLLKPNKNADPDLTIMATSTFLLKELKQNQFEKISELRLALMENNKNAVALLEPSLELLFILGLGKVRTSP